MNAYLNLKIESEHASIIEAQKYVIISWEAKLQRI